LDLAPVYVEYEFIDLPQENSYVCTSPIVHNTTDYYPKVMAINIKKDFEVLIALSGIA